MNKKHKLSLAILLALVAGNASAAFTDTSTTAGSSILFSAIDENTNSANYGATFVFDLALGDAGLNYNSFVNGTQGTTGTLSWDLSQNAAFTAYQADNTQLEWTVIGGAKLASGGTNGVNGGVLTTDTGSASSFATGVAPLVSSLSTGSIGSYFQNVNVALATNSISTNVATFTQGNITNNITSTNLGSLQTDASSPYANLGGAGNTISFWLIDNGNTSTRNPTNNIVSNIGSFALSGNTLTYTSAAASAVPLPATVWVFLSGLLGVMGLKRRAKQA
jgi:hypothetical protein